MVATSGIETVLIGQFSSQVDDTRNSIFKGSFSVNVPVLILVIVCEHKHGLIWVETASKLVRGGVQLQGGDAS